MGGALALVSLPFSNPWNGLSGFWLYQRSKQVSSCLLGTLRQELFRPEQEGVIELGVVHGWRNSKCYRGVVL